MKNPIIRLPFSTKTTTTHRLSKAKLAFYIRLILIVVIPLIYYISTTLFIVNHVAPNINQINRLSNRRLLSVLLTNVEETTVDQSISELVSDSLIIDLGLNNDTQIISNKININETSTSTSSSTPTSTSTSTSSSTATPTSTTATIPITKSIFNSELIPLGIPRKNCTPPAILEFPSDGFTKEQRRQGWIALHILFACYCFWLLAIVCDDYFVPAVEGLCSTLNMKEDVVGATFMAAASSSPELFINCVGTFITQSDLGVGAVVGSAVFNVLAVPACCGLFAGQIVKLDWWPVTRDCLMYGVSVVSLICVLFDGIVMWYEGLALVLMYTAYIIAMYFNDEISKSVRKFVSYFSRSKKEKRCFREVTEFAPLLSMANGKSMQKKTFFDQKLNSNIILPTIIHEEPSPSSSSSSTSSSSPSEEEYKNQRADCPWKITPGDNCCAFIFRWPIITALWLTIPDCRKHPRLRSLTFLMCIVWIGMTSYLVAFLITIIGDTINIADSIMGLTFLAAGTSVPEAVSSIIVTNQGHGAMGISNSIGSNTFDILLCLGLPWFVKAYFMPTIAGQNWITLNSTGLTYSAISLLSTLFGLYIAFALNKFYLDWKIGLTCSFVYIGFLVFASLVELNVFFPVNLPQCKY